MWDIITEKIKNFRPDPVKLKIGATNITVMAAALIVMILIITSAVSKRIYSAVESEMFAKANIIAEVIADDEQEDSGRYISESLIGTGMRGILLDGGAAVVYDTESADIGKVFTSSLITGAFSGEQGSLRSKSDGGASSLSVCVPVKKGGSVCGAMYFSKQLASEDRLVDFVRGSLIVSGILIMIIIGFLSVRMGYSIAVPMTDFIDTAQEISKGNFDKRIELRGNKDIDRLAEAMNYMCAELEHLEAKRRKFVSDASHELKTPMATIKLVCDSITSTPDPDPAMVKDFLADLSEEVDRLTRIIEKLLLLTKLDSGQTHLTPEFVDFGLMLQRIKNKLVPIAVSKNITINLDVPDDMMPIMLDYDRIWEAVYNVVDNAVKYSKIGSVVKMHCICTESELELDVIDSGKGIPDEYKERIFERFYRLDDSRARETGGTGLGLSIAREAVQLHGGALYVVDNADGGSCFVIKLPVNSGAKKQEE